MKSWEGKGCRNERCVWLRYPREIWKRKKTDNLKNNQNKAKQTRLSLGWDISGIMKRKRKKRERENDAERKAVCGWDTFQGAEQENGGKHFGFFRSVIFFWSFKGKKRKATEKMMENWTVLSGWDIFFGRVSKESRESSRKKNYVEKNVVERGSFEGK